MDGWKMDINLIVGSRCKSKIRAKPVWWYSGVQVYG